MGHYDRTSLGHEPDQLDMNFTFFSQSWCISFLNLTALQVIIIRTLKLSVNKFPRATELITGLLNPGLGLLVIVWC